jgi:hypothetical protein
MGLTKLFAELAFIDEKGQRTDRFFDHVPGSVNGHSGMDPHEMQPNGRKTHEPSYV